jgi:stearoyl-CoA desaturase (Delta-9 desaturase)
LEIYDIYERIFQTVSADLIRKRVLRTGDGTHRYTIEELSEKNIQEMMELYSNQKLDENDNLWGWGK